MVLRGVKKASVDLATVIQGDAVPKMMGKKPSITVNFAYPMGLCQHSYDAIVSVV